MTDEYFVGKHYLSITDTNERTRQAIYDRFAINDLIEGMLQERAALFSMLAEVISLLPEKQFEIKDIYALKNTVDMTINPDRSIVIKVKTIDQAVKDWNAKYEKN